MWGGTVWWWNDKVDDVLGKRKDSGRNGNLYVARNNIYLSANRGAKAEVR